MTERPWLVDKSALVRLGDCQKQELWAERIERGLVHITTITLLEAGYSARSAADMGELLDCPPLSLMPVEYLTPAAEKRATNRAQSPRTAECERGPTSRRLPRRPSASTSLPMRPPELSSCALTPMMSAPAAARASAMA